MRKWSVWTSSPAPVPFYNVSENICETDATNWTNYTRRYRKQERTSTSLSASLKGLTERWAVGVAALQPPCAPLGLPASLLPPSYAAHGSGGGGLWVAGPIISPWISLRRVSARLKEAGCTRAELWPTYSAHLWLSVQQYARSHIKIYCSILTYIFEKPYWIV